MRQLSVIIPTFNEQGNPGKLYHLVKEALASYSWEMIFVDDVSTDNTLNEISTLCSEYENVRLIRRYGRRGLSSACIEGMMASTSEYVAVMDADLQHDERLLPDMLSTLQNDKSIDMVVGSRYCEGASLGTLVKHRALLSQYATKFSQLFLKTKMTDPMSGFFMIRMSALDKVVQRLSGIGYKILLDIVMTAKGSIALVEIPYDMRSRECGDSKLDLKVTYDYFLLIADKTLGQFIPIRLLMFFMVGAVGVALHLFFVWILHVVSAVDFVIATVISTYLAMTSNFILNNKFTYKDKELSGSGLAAGYISFVLACSFGAFVNVAVAKYVYSSTEIWWLSGLLGAVIGSVWNYTMSSILTWKSW